MTGKDKCKVLKKIRVTMAEMNHIDYHPTECEHDGPCSGSCPQCDREAEYLNDELRKREAAGCPVQIDMESVIDFQILSVEPTEEEDILMGIVAPLDDDLPMWPEPTEE